jgi:hypothetical protein
MRPPPQFWSLFWSIIFAACMGWLAAQYVGNREHISSSRSRLTNMRVDLAETCANVSAVECEQEPGPQVQLNCMQNKFDFIKCIEAAGLPVEVPTGMGPELAVAWLTKQSQRALVVLRSRIGGGAQ